MSQFGLGPAALNPSRIPDMQVGEASERGWQFCPWKLVRAYPHLYVGGNYQGEVGSFFKAMLFEDRSWEFFFLLDPGVNGRDPLLLIPSAQFEEFLNDANAQLGMQLYIPRGGASADFLLTFEAPGIPLPRYIGRVESERAVEALKPRISRLPKDDLSNLNPTSLRGYKDKMDWIYNSFKTGKNKKDPEAARLKRSERQRGYGRMVKRAQRYLGLRDRTAYQSSHGTLAAGWNVDTIVPFRTKDSLRFVCVDVEAWEMANQIITEVGIAILDTEDTMSVPPGRNGHKWFSLIRSHHLRIREHIDKVNYKFVRGCPRSFDFGESEFVSSRDISRRVGAIIGDNESKDRRPIVMVGHDLGQDLKYLLKNGYNTWRVPQFLDEMDTKSMFQRWEGSPNGRGLAYVCDELGIPAQNFHNAGNDATYTLRAMIVIAVKQLFGNSAELEEEKASGLDYSEWSEGEMDDGGLPQKSAEPVPQATSSTAWTSRVSEW